MSRGINFNKITNPPVSRETRSRDWENVPVQKISRLVKGMPPTSGLDPQQEKKILVSFYLNQSTVRYFKKEANLQGAKYQRMMRAVLELYRHAHS